MNAWLGMWAALGQWSRFSQPRHKIALCVKSGVVLAIGSQSSYLQNDLHIVIQSEGVLLGPYKGRECVCGMVDGLVVVECVQRFVAEDVVGRDLPLWFLGLYISARLTMVKQLLVSSCFQGRMVPEFNQKSQSIINIVPSSYFIFNLFPSPLPSRCFLSRFRGHLLHCRT